MSPPGSSAWSASSQPSPSAATSARGAGELVHVDVKKLGRIEPVGHRVSGHRAAITAPDPLTVGPGAIAGTPRH